MKELLELFWIFFKLGLFTFGGGYAMIPHIKECVLEKKKWLSEEEFLELIAIAESTPGPIAINMATYIGFKRKKVLGSLFSTIGVVLPSLTIIFVISLFYEKFKDLQYVKYAFLGIKSCVAFLIFKTGVQMLIKMPKKVFNIICFCFVLTLIIIFEFVGFKFSSVIYILFFGLLSMLIYLINNRKKVKE